MNRSHEEAELLERAHAVLQLIIDGSVPVETVQKMADDIRKHRDAVRPASHSAVKGLPRWLAKCDSGHDGQMIATPTEPSWRFVCCSNDVGEEHLQTPLFASVDAAADWWNNVTGVRIGGTP